MDSAGVQLIAVAIMLSSVAWAVAFVVVAMMADKQVSRIIGTREDQDFDKKLEAHRESVDEQLHSMQETLVETQKTANNTAVQVGLSPPDDRRRQR